MGLTDKEEAECAKAKTPGKPLCKKCGGKTVAVIDPIDFETRRKCIVCEVKIVEQPNAHPYAEYR